jgi:protein involved in polysaccharide export with SLBB domain
MVGKRTNLPWMALAALAFITLSPAVLAQTKLPSTLLDRTGSRDKEMTSFEAATQTTVPGPALESVIDPDNYVVGPSDGFGVSIWTDPPRTLRLTVTPEGTLIIPTVGEFRVAGMTLTRARETLGAEIRKRYKFGEATVTLVAPRNVVVTVQGRVLKPGSFVLPAFARVDKAIEEANRSTDLLLADDLRGIRSDMSTRRILVRHNDGTQVRVDLKKFLVTKDDRWNPYLREGDIIIVPANDFSRNVFGIYGHVNVPGRYEFVQGDSARDALRIAFGFTPLANTDSVEFIRQNLFGDTESHSIINGESILSSGVGDFPLQPGDRLVVPGHFDLRGDYTVSVSGMVKNPGVYPITRNSTRIADVIRSAGGFREEASLISSELTRRSVGKGEIEIERLQSLRGGVPPEDSSYYYLETSLRMRKELVQTDFVALFVHGDTTQNIVVQDGDGIVVPQISKTIYVFGQVVNPGHITYSPGKDAWYYIQRAGGVTDRARTGDIKIVKARTRQWISPDGNEIFEGDYVWVPKDPERPFGYILNIVAQSAAVLSAAVSIALLAIQLGK